MQILRKLDEEKKETIHSHRTIIKLNLKGNISLRSGIPDNKLLTGNNS